MGRKKGKAQDDAPAGDPAVASLMSPLAGLQPTGVFAGLAAALPSASVLRLASTPEGLAALQRANPTNWPMLVQQAQQHQAVKDYEASKIHVEVQELAAHFQVEEYQTRELDQLLKGRPDTFDDDIYGLWDNLKNAYNPGGMLYSKMKEMTAGTYVGKPRPDAEVMALVRKFKLDESAATKLAQVFSKMGDQKKAKLDQLDKHLEVSNQPSARVMMMLKKLRDGDPLGEVNQKPAQGSWLDQQQNSKKEHNRGSSRDRDRDRGRSRDRSRSRRPRERSRSRRRSDRHRD